MISQNEDTATHTATADDDSFGTAPSSRGKIKSETFKRAGTSLTLWRDRPDDARTVEVVEKGLIFAAVPDGGIRRAAVQASRRDRRVATAVTGPRGRWVAIAVWGLIGVAGLLGRAEIGDVTAAGQSSFLPSDSESTRAMTLSSTAEGGEEVPVVIVFERDGGLTKADLNAIGRIGERPRRAAASTGATPIIDPFSADSRSAARATWRGSPTGSGRSPATAKRPWSCWRSTPATAARSSTGVDEIRHYLNRAPAAGARRLRDRAGGIAADLEQVADEAGKTLLIATLGLVLVLLLAVYRAPLLALLPLLVVGAAYLVATGIAYLLIEAGWITVNAEGTMLLLVLIFGAGTDYSLLLVHRYREELRAASRAGGGAADGAARERAGDRRLGRHRDRGDAGPAGRRPAVDPLARADPRDRDRGDARRRLHPAAGAARAARRARLLAAAASPAARSASPSRCGRGSWARVRPGRRRSRRDRRRRLRRPGRARARQPHPPRHDRLRPGRDAARPTPATAPKC